MVPPDNSLAFSQAGRQAVRHSARHRALQASQGNSATPQAGSASPQAGKQVVRHPGRHRPPRLPRVTVLPLRQVVPAPGKTYPPNRLLQGSSSEEPNPKWVINLCSKPLTQAQRSVLAKGPNFVVSPKLPPNLEYIAAIETACTKLSQQDAEELRADINRVLRSSHPPNPI